MSAKNFFPHPKVNHVWFEELSFRAFPGKLKSVGRMVAAETAAATTVVETNQKQ